VLHAFIVIGVSPKAVTHQNFKTRLFAALGMTVKKQVFFDITLS